MSPLKYGLPAIQEHQSERLDLFRRVDIPVGKIRGKCI